QPPRPRDRRGRRQALARGDHRLSLESCRVRRNGRDGLRDSRHVLGHRPQYWSARALAHASVRRPDRKNGADPHRRRDPEPRAFAGLPAPRGALDPIRSRTRTSGDSMNLERFSLALSDPLSTADGTIDAREGFVVEIEYEGTRGIGEATPLSGWTESIDACERALERARHACEESWAMALAELEDTPAARHGLSLALCDARSRAADVPLHRHFGAGHTERV